MNNLRIALARNGRWIKARKVFVRVQKLLSAFED